MLLWAFLTRLDDEKEAAVAGVFVFWVVQWANFLVVVGAGEEHLSVVLLPPAHV